MSSDVQPLAPVGGVAPIGQIALVAPVTAPGGVAAIEVGAYSIDTYKRCGQHPLEYCKVQSEGFAGAMKKRGHKETVSKTGPDVSPKQWEATTDSAPDGIDTVDMAYIASHGSTYGKELPPATRVSAPIAKSNWLYWFLATCDSSAGCLITTIRINPNTWQPPDAKNPVTNMRLGDGKLRWLVLDCCRSQQIGIVNEKDPNARAQLTDTLPGPTWSRCYDGIQMLFGFTGLTTDGWWVRKRGKSFGARAGRGDVLSDSWLDEAYSWFTDDIPAVTAFAQSPAELDTRLKSESLKKPGSPPARPVKGFVFASMWRS